MSKKKKLVIVVPSLVACGAERVMSFIANNISKEHFETTLWIASVPESTVYNVDSIKVKYFNKSRVLNAIPSFFWSLRKEKPDLVVSTLSYLNTAMGLLSVFFPKIKFIGREANVHNVDKFEKGTKKIKRIGAYIPLNFGYRFLDIIICQSNDMYNDLNLNYGIPNSKLKTINNPITDNFKLEKRLFDRKDYFQFITVGRLSKQKGHKRIISVLAKLNIPFKYTIIGDGPEKDAVFKLIEQLGLSETIIHIPYTNEVSKYLAKSDLFLQGSYFEGFPNCLLESSAMGTPIVGFQAPGGIDEIIENGINGFIAEDEEKFAYYILKSINDHQWNPEIISKTVTDKFNKDKILKEYESLFLEVIG